MVVKRNNEVFGVGGRMIAEILMGLGIVVIGLMTIVWFLMLKEVLGMREITKALLGETK